MYVFDTSPLSLLFRNFYRSRFPTLWEKFDELIVEKRIVSRTSCKTLRSGELHRERATRIAAAKQSFP